MKYSIQKGVARETICGETILVSTLEARKVCPYLTQLNESSVFIWDQLEKGFDTEDIVKRIVLEYGISPLDAKEGLELFLNSMEENHYIAKEMDHE